MNSYAALIFTTVAGLSLTSISWADITPEPYRGCGGLEWEATSATTINVHRGNGDYLETIPGNSILWVAPETGTYFLVGADGGDWRDWTRSASVFVDVTESTGCVDPTLSYENSELNLLSETELEINWDLTGLSPYAYMQVIVGLPGSTVSDTNVSGTRFFIDNLSPDELYTIGLIPFDQYGNSGDVELFIDISTSGVVSQNQAMEALNLRADVYSSTAMELFWQHNTDFVSGQSSYTVSLNGVPVATGLNGTSLFFDELMPGTQYELGVTVTKPGSAPSSLATINATTAGGATQPPGPGGGSEPPTNVEVNAGIISWSDSGWYQVQNATTYATLCEGGSSCSVPPGRYIVINHHTGVRTTILAP